LQALNSHQAYDPANYIRQESSESGSGLVVDLDLEQPEASQALPYFVDSLVNNSFGCYGMWTTLGSDRVEPCAFLSKSLPPSSGATAMLDGLWEQWRWNVPVRPLA